MIQSEFSKQLDTVSDLTYDDISCHGFVDAACHIDNLRYQGKLLADELILKGIDPTVRFHKGSFIEIPIDAEVKNAKFSLFDISNMLKDKMQAALKDFFAKYTKNYDIHLKANILTDGESVRAVDITDLDAEDKITPFRLSAKVSKLDTFPILEKLHGTFDFSNKRIVFYDLMKRMRVCCKDQFPKRYLKMSDGEIWDDMIKQTSKILKFNMQSQFNQTVETDLMKAMLVLLQEKKNILDIDVKAKKETPLEQTVMMFFIAGPDEVKDVYDMKVIAK